MIKTLIQSFRKKKKEKILFQQFKENKVNYDQFVEYISFGTDLPALHIIKQNNIRKYKEEYQFNLLIETGTYLGDMVEAQRNHFREVYSIELGEDLYKNAVKRFKPYANVKIIHGDSGAVLRTLMPKITEPALFWLDGHYSAGITAKGNKSTPIFEELESILNAEFIHGILIDDARLFVGQNDYPSIDELAAFITGKDSSRQLTVSDDIIKIFKNKP
ncbi:MAG TPA: hypothetical protein VN040_09875 [Pseudosphingobacterium sp.]|nr:hypothetical protein [Pseudosphingobacterium sp.]